MAPLTQSIAKQRARWLAEQNDDFAFPSEQTSIVTYGKLTRPLPLRGTHFIRAHTYDIPADDDEKPAQLHRPTKTPARRLAPDDPPLSKDELEAVYVPPASLILSPCSGSWKPISCSKGGINLPRRQNPEPAPANIVPYKKGTTRARANGSMKPGWPDHAMQAEISQQGAPYDPPLKQITTQRRVQLRRQKPKLRSGQLSQARCLPVNELFLVISPPETVSYEAPHSSPGLQIESPVEAISSSFDTCRASPPQRNAGPRAALKAIRKQIKAPLLRQKSVISLQKQQRARMPLSLGPRCSRYYGDGFDSLERNIDSCLKFRKQRQARKPLFRGFQALRLQAGPLPDVKFEPSRTKLDLEGVNAEPVLECSLEHVQDPSEAFSEPSRGNSIRNTSLCDRIFKDTVRNQLSSISAPKRIISVSSSDSGEEDFVFTDSESEGQSNGQKHLTSSSLQDDQGEQADYDDHCSKQLSPRALLDNQNERQNRNFCTRVPSAVNQKIQSNVSITRSIHKSARPTKSEPRAPLTSRRQTKVDDDIVTCDPGDHPTSDIKFVQPRIVPSRSIATPSYTPEYGPSSKATSQQHRQNSRYFTTAADMLDTDKAPRPRITKHRSIKLRENHVAPRGRSRSDQRSMVCETLRSLQNTAISHTPISRKEA